MEYKKLNEIYEQLQSRCVKCNTPINSISQAKLKKDKDGNNVVLCLDCVEKYKEEYRDFIEELTERALWIIVAMLVLGKNKD